MVPRCMVKDRNAAESIDGDALLIDGSVAVLAPEASAALLAEYGWRDLSPRALTRMTVEASPLHLDGLDGTGPLETTGTLHVVVGPGQAAIVAVEIVERSRGDRAGAVSAPMRSPSAAEAEPSTEIDSTVLPDDDPRRPVLTPIEEWGDYGAPSGNDPLPFPTPFDPGDAVQASPLCHFFPGLSRCRR